MAWSIRVAKNPPVGENCCFIIDTTDKCHGQPQVKKELYPTISTLALMTVHIQTRRVLVLQRYRIIVKIKILTCSVNVFEVQSLYTSIHRISSIISQN